MPNYVPIAFFHWLESYHFRAFSFCKNTVKLTPVVIAYASANGLGVAPFAMLVSMNMIHQYLLPVTNLSNIIGLATEEVTAGELMKTGAVLSLYAAAFMALMVYAY